MATIVSTLAALLLLLVGTAAPAAAQRADFCAGAETPHFANGFADLKAVLGETMGQPLECEHPNTANGDTLQQTTLGLSFYDHTANTPQFTDGWNHWALGPAGVVAWTGDQAPAALLASNPIPPETQCVQVGGGTCLRTEVELADTLTMLAQTHTAAPLLRIAGLAGYVIHYGDLAAATLGLFRPSRGDVVLNSVLKTYPTIDRGPVLAHELQHVTDWIVDSRALRTERGCLATETNAFHTEAATWSELVGTTRRPAANDLEREFNAIANALAKDPSAFADRLSTVYHDECQPG
ncbi:MAG TPA: hypothetical protein VGQ62_09920 [Chloroflexota bacterium]|nr:hypothetical protein [Chloroflexota bacterium]